LFVSGYDLDCFDFTDLKNGNITLVENNKHHELHLSCFPGFVLIGKQVIVCDEKQWKTEPKPYCVHGK
jgi:hypothetical protein